MKRLFVVNESAAFTKRSTEVVTASTKRLLPANAV